MIKDNLKNADFNMFLLSSNTGMTKFIEEVLGLGEKFPAIHMMITDDQDALAHDGALKRAVWDRPGRQGRRARRASQPSDGRLLDRLARPAHRRALRTALGEWGARHQRAAGRGRKVTHGTLDSDPFPSEVHGRPPGGA